MSENTALLIEAYQRGRAWIAEPEFANLHNLNPDSVAKMDGSESDAKLLIRSLQLSDINFDPLVLAFHKRMPDYDGSIGPATKALVNIPRCPLPDAPPPAGASFHYDDPDLQAAVESMQRAAAVGITGPYWRGCDSQRPDVHSLVIGIDTKEAPSVFKSNQEKILAARIAMAAEIGVAVRFVINPTSMAGLQQYQVYRYIAGGVIGMNYFPSSNSCGRIPNGSMDSSYNPTDWKRHANLGGHESEGHGFGFNHTRGGRMNPSLIDTPLTWIGDPAWSQIVKYYPAKPLEPDQPPPPPPPPPGPKPDGSLVLGGVTYDVFKRGTKPNPIEV